MVVILNFKKYFHILSKKQKCVILEEVEQIKDVYNVQNTKRINFIEQEKNKFYDNQRICSNCGSKKNINKITTETTTSPAIFVFSQNTTLCIAFKKE